MRKQNGFQELKKLINSYKPGELIYPIDLHIKLKKMIKHSTIMDFLNRFLKAGYIFNAISIKNGYRKGTFIRSTKQIKENLNSTMLNDEISNIFDENLNEKFRTNFEYGYLLFYDELHSLNWIKKSKIEDYCVQKFVNVLLNIGVLKEENFIVRVSFIHPTEYNIPFNCINVLYRNRNFIPTNFLKKELL